MFLCSQLNVQCGLCAPSEGCGVQGLTKNLGLDVGRVGMCTKLSHTAQSTDIAQCAHKVCSVELKLFFMEYLSFQN